MAFHILVLISAPILIKYFKNDDPVSSKG